MTLFKKARWLGIAKFLAAGFLLFTAIPNAAFAAGSNVEDVIYNLDASTISMPEFMELIAYLMGLFCLYSAIMALKEFSQEPEKKPFKPALVRFIIAGLLIALPQTIKTISTSFGANTSSMPSLSRPSLIDRSDLNN